MSEHDLELLITLDDPEGAPEEDRFHHPHAENAELSGPSTSLQQFKWRVS